MTFAPESKAGDFEAIGYDDLLLRTFGDGASILRALKAGDLVARVQAEGEPPNCFYRVPFAHWDRANAFLEGEPASKLFCWGDSSVPARLWDRPVLFFRNEVEAWETTLPIEHVAGVQSGPESVIADKATFAECLERAEMPREGYWTAYSTLAWIVSRDDRFVAATQLFEQQSYADRAVHGAFVWRTLGTIAGQRFGKTYSDAEGELREALEAGSISGGIATDLRTGIADLLPQHRWTQWSRSFERVGLVLIPGFNDFKWPSEKVREAFPAAPLSQPKPRPRLAAKSGPRKRPAAIAKGLKPIFERHHDLIAEMTTRQRHAHVLRFWAGDDKAPSVNAVERHWQSHLERRARG
jgi:hypothetical protein